jgi:predicted alpha/beta hydrolase
VLHVASEGPARSDVTGVLAAFAGIALLALAVWVPLRHRGERPHRWRNGVVAVVAGAIAAYLVVLPMAVAIVAVHAPREAVGAPPGPTYRPVRFPAADGLQLSGWYVPSRNRAAVLVVHGGGGDRTGARRHAALLAGHGYGVLLHDARGRGSSEGTPNAFGWDWERDVEGALAFLRARPDVDPDRIGGLGLSTGADVLIQVAAARDDPLRAVVADGATGESLADAREVGTAAVDLPYWAVLYTAAQVLSGSSPGPALAEAVPRVAPTPLLLVAAGDPATEGRFNRRYADAARAPSALWQLRGVGHTAALRERPAEYERRVVGLLDAALRVAP